MIGHSRRFVKFGVGTILPVPSGIPAKIRRGEKREKRQSIMALETKHERIFEIMHDRTKWPGKAVWD
jgi:hypothetical protein